MPAVIMRRTFAYDAVSTSIENVDSGASVGRRKGDSEAADVRLLRRRGVLCHGLLLGGEGTQVIQELRDLGLDLRRVLHDEGAGALLVDRGALDVPRAGGPTAALIRSMRSVIEPYGFTVSSPSPPKSGFSSSLT